MIKSIVTIGSRRIFMNKLSIGKMAGMCNVSIQTLRYYDQINLVKPIFRDENNNYRYYDISQVFRINIIKYLQYSGLSIQEIKKVLALSNYDLMEFWKQQEKEIDKEVVKLQKSKRLIKGQQEQLHQLSIVKEISQGETYVRTIPEEQIIWIKPKSNLTPLSYPDDEVSDLDNILLEKETVANLQYGFSYDLKDYETLKDIKYDGIFTQVFVDQLEISKAHLEVIPSSEYFCISFLWDRTRYYDFYNKLKKEFQIKYGHFSTKVYELSTVDNYKYTNEKNFYTELRIKIPAH